MKIVWLPYQDTNYDKKNKTHTETDVVAYVVLIVCDLLLLL